VALASPLSTMSLPPASRDSQIALSLPTTQLFRTVT
jgi:hypothetical protein